MPITTTLAACNTNPALNGPAGTDLPSQLDDALRYALSFIAELRDGAAVRTGAIMMFPSTTAPLGFVKLNGSLLSRTTYAALFAYASSIGLVSEATWSGGQNGSFSVGDGSTTFRVPDARAVFFRGLDEARGLDAGRVLGVFQDHVNVTHTHGINDPGHAHGVSDPGHAHGVSDPGHNHQFGNSSNVANGGGSPSAFNVGTLTATQNSLTGISIFAAGTGIAIVGNGTGISTQANGGADGHPRNLAYPFYIKY